LLKSSKARIASKLNSSQKRFAAEVIGALLASLFVMSFIGSEASLGANTPDYSYPIPLIFGIEI
jgi:hypothetical protein